MATKPDVDPEKSQDLDRKYGRFAGSTYEAVGEEAIYGKVDRTTDSRRRARHKARKRRNW